MSNKVNYNAKTGDVISIDPWMGKNPSSPRTQFRVKNTYPDSISVMVVSGSQEMTLTYEELKQMDAEFISESASKERLEQILSKRWSTNSVNEEITEDSIAQTLISYVDDTKKFTDVLWVLCAITKNQIWRANKKRNPDSAQKWAELEQKLRNILDT
jgi:DNA-binding NtrC family response regulator